MTGTEKRVINETDADGVVKSRKKIFEYQLSPAAVENNARFFIHFMQHRMMGVGRYWLVVIIFTVVLLKNRTSAIAFMT